MEQHLRNAWDFKNPKKEEKYEASKPLSGGGQWYKKQRGCAMGA